MTKTEIRREMQERRRAIGSDDKLLWDRQIFQRAHKDRAFQIAERVHVFRSTPEEIDTWPFIEYAWGIGADVYCPRVTAGGQLEHVRVRRSSQWVEGGFGILEPIAESNADILSIKELDTLGAVVVPLLAFDRTGHRVGYGKGMYDGFLAATSARRIGIGYEFQRVASLPTEDHDQPLHAIATNERWYHVA